MNSITFAFIITMIAGLSTLLGLIPIYIKFKNINKIICISLAFAAGVMLSVSINSLLEESISLLNKNLNIVKTIILVILFILIGILVSKLLDILFKKIDNKLYKLGITNAIALMIHNIPEGILTFSTTSINISLGLTLALSIMCHNIPEGISISVPIYYSTKSRKKAWIYVLISGFSESLGGIFSYLFLYRFINNSFIGITLAFTIGIMSYISLVELLPNSIKYNYKKTSSISFIIGYIFMMFFK